MVAFFFRSENGIAKTAFLYRRPCRPPRASPPAAAPPASPLRSGPPLCPSPSDASRASAPPAVRSGRENRQRRFLLAGVSRFRLTPTKRSTMACQDRLGTSTRKTRRPLMVHQKPTTINGPPKAVFRTCSTRLMQSFVIATGSNQALFLSSCSGLSTHLLRSTLV